MKYPPPLRNFEDLPAEREIDICHETMWQNFCYAHAALYYALYPDRHLISRNELNARRSAALSEWKTATA